MGKRILLLLLIALIAIHSPHAEVREFPEYGVSIDVPPDWATETSEDSVSIWESPKEGGHWDGESFLFKAVEGEEPFDCSSWPEADQAKVAGEYACCLTDIGQNVYSCLVSHPEGGYRYLVKFPIGGGSMGFTEYYAVADSMEFLSPGSEAEQAEALPEPEQPKASGSTYYCDSCEDCTAALFNEKYDAVYLSGDISTEEEVCIGNRHFATTDPNETGFSNKVFDCQGHEISCEHGYCSWGIRLGLQREIFTTAKWGGKIEWSGNIVQNCRVSNFQSGFVASGDDISGTIFANNTASDCKTGFLLGEGTGSLAMGNAANDNEIGFYAVGSQLSNNFAYGNSKGFELWADSKAYNNTAYGNEYGFLLLGPAFLQGNTAFENSEGGFTLSHSYCNLSRNTAYGNKYGFIMEYGGGTLTENIAYGNSQHGFYASDSGTSHFMRNSAYNNSVAGFRIGGNGDELYGNIAYENGIGLRVSGNGGTIKENKFCGNHEADIKIDKALLELKDNCIGCYPETLENTCGNSENWYDGDMEGCAYSCHGFQPSHPFEEQEGGAPLPEELLSSIAGIFSPENETAEKPGPEAAEVYLVTSRNLICPESVFEDACPYWESTYKLKDALEQEGRTVRVVDLGLQDYWTTSVTVDNVFGIVGPAGEKASRKFRESAPGLGSGNYVIIIGGYSVVPPCTYDDELGDDEEYLSDDCYGTSGGGPAEASVSRLPHGGAPMIGYMNAMADYHISRSRGSSGLNGDRMLEAYGRPCPYYDLDFYYLYEMPESSGHFTVLEGVHVQPHMQDVEVEGFPEWHAYPMQYFSFHGAPGTYWADDQGNPVIRAESQLYPFLAFSTACYGGFLTGSSIAETWLYSKTTHWGNRPNAFIGSTGISYHSTASVPLPLGGQLLRNEFHSEFESGKTAGEALAAAKQATYDYEYTDLTGQLSDLLHSIFTGSENRKMNRKVAMEYQLYGDPFLTKKDMVNSNDPACDGIG